MNIPENWAEGDLDLGDSLIHYYRAGVTGGPAALLLHGFSDHGPCWIQTAIMLSSNFDVIMPDARAHGRSARITPGRDYDIVEDAIRVMSLMAITQPIVFGHSMGALQAAELAARRPDLVKALVLIDPPWFGTLEEGVTIMRADTSRGNWDWVRQLPGKTIEQLIVENKAEHPTWPDVIVQAFSEGKKRLDQNVLDTTLIPLTTIRRLVEAIHCPTLLFTGDPELGSIVTPQLAHDIAQRNPNFRVAHIEQAGHHLNFSHEAAYFAAVQPFLSAIAQ